MFSRIAYLHRFPTWHSGILKSVSGVRKLAHCLRLLCGGFRLTDRLNSFSSRIFQQNTYRNKYTETSKRQEGSPCRDRGAILRLKGPNAELPRGEGTGATRIKRFF